MDRTDQYVGGDAELRVQLANHFNRQAPRAIEHFGHPRAGAEYLFQIFASQVLLLHSKRDRFEWIGRIHGVVLGW